MSGRNANAKKIEFTPMVQLLTLDEAASFLWRYGCSINTKQLAGLAHEGGGPPYGDWGDCVLYSVDRLLSWARGRASERRNNTSEASSEATNTIDAQVLSGKIIDD